MDKGSAISTIQEITREINVWKMRHPPSEDPERESDIKREINKILQMFRTQDHNLYLLPNPPMKGPFEYFKGSVEHEKLIVESYDNSAEKAWGKITAFNGGAWLIFSTNPENKMAIDAVMKENWPDW
jgi:hypothetical protein